MKYLILIFTLILTACGGGGSSTSSKKDEPSLEITNAATPSTQEIEKNVTTATTTLGTENLLPSVSTLSSVPPKQVNKMVVNAGDDRNATVNQPITLTGTVSNAGTEKLSYAWIKGTTLLATTTSFDYTPIEEVALPSAGARVDVLTFTVKTEEGGEFSDMINITVLNVE